MYQIGHGMPKHKKFMHMLEDPANPQAARASRECHAYGYAQG
jgi:hypothetical protein